MVPEAPLEDTGVGLVPAGEGWFVVNAKDARWRDAGPLTKLCFFEGEGAFWEVGVNLSVLEPGTRHCGEPQDHRQDGGCSQRISHDPFA